MMFSIKDLLFSILPIFDLFSLQGVWVLLLLGRSFSDLTLLVRVMAVECSCVRYWSQHVPETASRNEKVC